MQTLTDTIKKIKVIEGKRHITWTMDSDWKCVGCESNLPYKKSHEDWKFLAKAINKMLKEL
jgi:hypothetical protein